MSRHHPAGSASSPRSAAERRVLEQLAAQRRTLPRPAATSPLPAADVLAAEARATRPRPASSRIFGAPADGGSVLQDILDEFPEIDSTTVSVLLSMHDGRREPVVQRLEEVYRVPGKPPQKRHSFPASARRDVDATGGRAPARPRRPFSVDRVDEDDEDAASRVSEQSRSRGSLVKDEPVVVPRASASARASPPARVSPPGRAPQPARLSPPARASPPARVPPSTFIPAPSAPVPGAQGSRSFTATSTTATKRRAARRRQSNTSQDPPPAGVLPAQPPARHRQRSGRRHRRSDGDHGQGSGGDDASGGSSSRFGDERVGHPLLPPWGQDAPRARADQYPPVTVVPVSGRPRSHPASAALHQVVAEPAGVRIRSRAHEEEADDSGAMEEEGSVSSSGTSSSRTRGSPAPSSARSSVPSSGRAHTVSTRDSDGSGRMRSGTGRRHRVGNEGVGRRHRASRMRDLGHAMLDGLGRRANRSGSEGEVDEDEIERRDDAAVFADADAPSGVLRAAASAERIVRRAESVSGLSGDEADGEMVTVELGVLRKLVYKVEVAEKALADLTNDSRERVADLLKAVNGVSASLSHYDERQQKRFDVLSSVFTGNNDSIERLTCAMLTIRSELRDYEMRRSRRFWRMIGLKLVDLLAYVALFVVWVCASLYNVAVRQKRALGRLVAGEEGDEVAEEKNAIQRHASFEVARTDSGSFEGGRTDSGDGVSELVGKDFGSIAQAADEYESVPSEVELDVGRGVGGGDGVSVGHLG